MCEQVSLGTAGILCLFGVHLDGCSLRIRAHMVVTALDRCAGPSIQQTGECFGTHVLASPKPCLLTLFISSEHAFTNSALRQKSDVNVLACDLKIGRSFPPVQLLSACMWTVSRQLFYVAHILLGGLSAPENVRPTSFILEKDQSRLADACCLPNAVMPRARDG